jgi:exosortase
MVLVWYTTPDYGHGFVVPIFAAFLLWQRQEMVDPWPSRGSWWGLLFFLIFAGIRWANFLLNYERDIDALLPFLIGMTLVIGGWRALHWAWPSILFLIFMVPLPAVLAEALGRYLQRIATIMSLYLLQTIGIPAIVRGELSNVIQLSDPNNKLEVAQACSGLRMMTLFFAICVGACFVLRVPFWKKIILVLSAAPIAIVSNVARITLTGVLAEWVSPEAGHFVHDKAGFLMMPLAMLMIWGEMALIAALVIEPPTEGPFMFAGGKGAPRRDAPTGAGRAGPAPERPRRQSLD